MASVSSYNEPNRTVSTMSMQANANNNTESDTLNQNSVEIQINPSSDPTEASKKRINICVKFKGDATPIVTSSYSALDSEKVYFNLLI